MLQHCIPQSIRRTLNQLPISLDETYERVLKEIGPANRDHAHRLLQCLTMAIRPLRVVELAEILALDFDGQGEATPHFNEDWRWEDRQRSVLSTCSSLITVVEDGDSRVIQFSHFSVKEFLTSDRLSTSKGDASYFHIMAEPAHTTLARACLGILHQLDGSSDHSYVNRDLPFVGYASEHWVEHAQFGLVSSRIEDGMRRLFDSTKPYFSAWLQLHDIDDQWPFFGAYKTENGRGSPLYYASLCGFRDLAAHIIVEHPEQVNAKGGQNYSPLAAALHKRHTDMAELLYQHGAAVDVIGGWTRTLLQAASLSGIIDVVRWLLDHGADADSQDVRNWTPLHLATSDGHLEVVRTLLRHGVCINAATAVGYTTLYLASLCCHVEISRLLLQHGADVNARAEDYMTPLHEASRRGGLEVARLLLDYGADVDAEDEVGRTPLHLASYEGRVETSRLLLDCGASVYVRDKEGNTPLQVASRRGKHEIVQMLIEHGAQVDK